MAVVYILYSESIGKYYVGSCKDLDLRIEQHKSGDFDNSYTKRATDWILFYSIEDLEYQQARKIELHIKKMKSKRYIENLKRYKELSTRLVSRYKLE